MTRTALTLLAAAGLSVWASAQTAAPTVGDHLRQLVANRDLLAGLLDHGLKLSDAADTLGRADECRGAAATLSAAVRAAARDADPDRVAELGDYLEDVLVNGLAPSLGAAQAEIKMGSPHYDKLVALEKQAADVAKSAADAVPADGPLGDRPDVKRVRGKLVEAGGRVK